MRKWHLLLNATAAALLLSAVSFAAEPLGLKEGTPDLKSAGPLAFAPQGTLLVADPQGAAIFAIATGDKSGPVGKSNLSVEGLEQKLAQLLQSSPSEIQINDLAVNPESGNIYLSLAVGEQRKPALVRIDGAGKLSQLSLDKVAFSKATLPNPPEDRTAGQGPRARNLRGDSITDIAFVDGAVIISGLSSASSPANVRSIAFPFTDIDDGAAIEIYHAAHGRVEDYAPARTFVAFNINGEPNLLAGFTCTPLVKFPIKDLKAGEKVRGTTVAELGNRNRPLDMIVYEKGGKSYLLMANSSRGVMKVSTEQIERGEGLTEPVRGGGTAGQSYETIESLQGVVQLDKLNETQAVIVVQTDGGALNLKTIELP
jgi:hypothetical protein